MVGPRVADPHDAVERSSAPKDVTQFTHCRITQGGNEGPDVEVEGQDAPGRLTRCQRNATIDEAGAGPLDELFVGARSDDGTGTVQEAGFPIGATGAKQGAVGDDGGAAIGDGASRVALVV